MDRQTMIVMCGLPRSGKSTYVDRQLNEMIDSEFLKKYEVKYDHEYS